MIISDELINKLSDLAKLDFSAPEKREKIKEDIERMLSFFSVIDQVQVDSLEPLVYPIVQYNVLRSVEDPIQNMAHEAALKNAPLKDTDYFKVLKIRED